MNRIRVLFVSVLVLIGISALQGYEPDKELYVHFTSSTVSLPPGQDSCSVGSLDAPDTVKTILNYMGANYVISGTRGFTFNPADTIEITPEGDTLRFPDLSAVFFVGFSSTQERDSALVDVDTLLDETVEVQKNCVLEICISDGSGGQYFSYIPNDYHYDDQWPLRLHETYLDIAAENAWEYSLGSSNILFGLTGFSTVAANHLDLNETGKISGDIGTDSYNTYSAGLMAAEIHNEDEEGGGIVGVAPLSRIWNKETDNISECIYAIYDLANAGCPVINCSVGFNTYFSDLEAACLYAYKKGSLTITGTRYHAGAQWMGSRYPAMFRNTALAINATIKDPVSYGTPYSSYTVPYEYTEACAPGGGSEPGEGVITTSYGSGSTWTWHFGTAVAASHAAGVCGLLKDLNPDLEPHDLAWILKFSADDMVGGEAGSGWDEYTGYGLINAERACKWVIPPYYLSSYIACNPGYDHALSRIGEENQKIEFTNDPRPGLPEGEYKCDVWELYEKHPTASFRSWSPVAWLNVVGYSKSLDGGSNNCREYLWRSQGSNYVEFRTYFYYLRKRKNGLCWEDVYKWAPCNPNNYVPPFKSTVVHTHYNTLPLNCTVEFSYPPYNNYAYINMPVPWMVDARIGVRYPIARTVESPDEGVTAYSGPHMFKFSGVDHNADQHEQWGAYLVRKVIDVRNTFDEKPLFVRAKLYVKESPEHEGHIALEGKTDKSGIPDESWLSRLFDDNYGYCVDRFGTKMKPQYMDFPEGEWVDMIYNITPATVSGYELSDIAIAYADDDIEEEGPFTCYIDYLAVMDHYPNPNEWYVEVFGGNKNGEVTWQINGNQIDLIVDGNGLATGESEGELSINPAIRLDTDPKALLRSYDVVRWEQYDKERALVLSVLLSTTPDGEGLWLKYAANAPDLWSQEGYVDMSPHTIPVFNEWEAFERNVVEDFNDEFTGPIVSYLYVQAVRIGHIARREWDGDRGGSVRWISIGGPGDGDEIPPLDELTVIIPNGGERWEIGTTHSVCWEMSEYNPDVEGFWVQYCTNFGTGNHEWKNITYYSYFYHVGGVGMSYDWDVPEDETPSKTCRVRVVAMKSENGILKPLGDDLSDKNFEIYKLFVGPSPAPAEAFVWPPEEQEGIICSNPMIAGGEFEIGWITDGIHPVDSVSLHYSTDGGETFQTIATGLDPGEEVVFDSCEIDSEMVYFTGLQGSYRWTVPETYTCGGKFRYVAYDSTGDSATYVFTETFTIPFGSGSMYSTAYTGCKLGDGSSKTCMVYTDASNNVRYTESDDGFEWDTTITVVQAGATPTVTIVNDTPVVVWKDNDASDQTLNRSAFPFTAVTPIVPAYGQGRIQILSEANVFTVEDSFYVGVFRAYGDPPLLSSFALIGKRSDLGGCVSSDTLFKATGSPVSAESKAPALVVDNDHNTYYAFVYDGKTAFIYDDGSSLDIDTITTTSVAWPSLDVTTGNVYLTYGTVVSGDTVILRKWRYTNDTIWRGTDTLYKGPVTHLSTAGGVFTSFTEPDEDMKLLTFDPLDGSTGTEDLADSIINPHIALSRLSGTELAFEWTERVGANYYVMSERSDADACLPHLYLEGGTTITPFTTHRGRTHDYGDIEVDIGADSLVYEIEDLDTSLDYKLRLEFYFESESTDSTDYIITAAGETDTVTVHEETLTCHTMVIDSLGTDLTVKITGDDVELTRLVFYEDNTGGGGSSSWSDVEDPDSEKRLPFMFSLEGVIPTPFTKTAQIRFAMPVSQHVTLKVYDVAGREVRTLVSGPVKAGVHTVDWNGKDNLSRSVSAGVYFVRMATEGYQATRKTVLLK